MQGAATLAGGTAAAVLLPTIFIVSPAKSPAPTSAVGDVSIVASDVKNVVDTSSGKVRGFTPNGIFTVKGMPRGGTTQGKNRFMRPTKPTQWTGSRRSPGAPGDRWDVGFRVEKDRI